VLLCVCAVSVRLAVFVQRSKLSAVLRLLVVLLWCTLCVVWCGALFVCCFCYVLLCGVCVCVVSVSWLWLCNGVNFLRFQKLRFRVMFLLLFVVSLYCVRRLLCAVCIARGLCYLLLCVVCVCVCLHCAVYGVVCAMYVVCCVLCMRVVCLGCSVLCVF